MVKFQVSLDTSSFKALRSLAADEYRDPRAQAALIIRAELQRRGLLAAQDAKSQAGPDAQDAQKSQSGPAPQGVQDAR
jgi:hypothetical protein